MAFWQGDARPWRRRDPWRLGSSAATSSPPQSTPGGLRLVEAPERSVADRGLARQWMACRDGDSQLSFWRTHAGQEVDFLVARGEELGAIEVKAAPSVARRDLAGIEACEHALGERLRLSIVLYRGDQLPGIGPRRIAAPFEVAFLGPRGKA